MTPRTRSKWLAHIRDFQASGLTLAAFAEARALNPATFRNYYYRLRPLVHSAKREEAPAFLPIQLEAQPTLVTQAGLTLVLPPSLRLHFDEAPAPRYLAELVGLLQGS